MTTDLAIRLGNTFMGAFNVPLAPTANRTRKRGSGVWRRLARGLFLAPGRIIARLGRRQAERDALLRYAMAEGLLRRPLHSELDRAVLLTGRADMLLPSCFVHTHRR